MIESPRTIIVDDPHYTASYHTVELDPDRVMTFVHLDVFYFSPSILKKLRAQYALFRQHVSTVLYCMGNEDDRTFECFVRQFDFQYLKDVPCTDGKTRRLFVNFGPSREAQEQGLPDNGWRKRNH